MSRPKPNTRLIPAPLINQAFDELLPIIDEISDRFPSPGHPVAPALLGLINWFGRNQISLEPWLKTPSRPRLRKVK
jgi:hypothetical protein